MAPLSSGGALGKRKNEQARGLRERVFISESRTLWRIWSRFLIFRFFEEMEKFRPPQDHALRKSQGGCYQNSKWLRKGNSSAANVLACYRFTKTFYFVTKRSSKIDVHVSFSRSFAILVSTTLPFFQCMILKQTESFQIFEEPKYQKRRPNPT